MWQGSLLNALADRRTALRTFFSWGAAGAAVATGVAACGGRPGGPAGGEAAGGAAPAAALPEINFGNPAENLKAFIKLTGDLDPTVSTVGWFGGDIFAVLGPDKPLVKLVGV
jgi:hypothetical protein